MIEVGDKVRVKSPKWCKGAIGEVTRRKKSIIEVTLNAGITIYVNFKQLEKIKER